MPKYNPVVANVLGTMGTICWTGELIPQIWKSYRDKKTIGLSPWFMLSWVASSALMEAYAILQHFNVSLQLQSQLYGVLSLISWGQCLYYDPSRREKRLLTFLIVIGAMIMLGALEVMLVFVSRPAVERGISAPVRLYGILSAVFLSGGLLPQYWEIYVRREVMGVSYAFILIDMLGGILGDLSLAFSDEFTGLAAASYTSLVVMDVGIILAALILNPRARRRRRRAEAGAGAAAAAAGPETLPAPSSVPPSPAGTNEASPSGGIDLEDGKARLDEEEKPIEHGVQGTSTKDDIGREEKGAPRSCDDPICQI